MTQQRMNVQAPITRLFANRWSPRAFDPDRRVSSELIATCLEAARWAPSCFGAQPWRFVVTNRFSDDHPWQATLDCLVAKNQEWAQRAPVLIIAVALSEFNHNGKANRWSEYDTGQAMLSFCLQATELGLKTHQMGGFNSDNLKYKLNIPNSTSIMSVTALGYGGEITMLDDAFQTIETTARTRLPLADICHDGHWGKPCQPLLSLGWQARYEESPAEELPWFHSELDHDFAEALTRFKFSKGDVLDIGCGPGTQAVALAELGFSVTATDVAQAAIDGAEQRAQRSGVTIRFLTGDAITMVLAQQFDLIIDRGVLHCFNDLDQRNRYINRIRNWLKPGGVLLLKCFSHKEHREQGPPCRFSPDDLCTAFADGFAPLDIVETQFQGSINDAPPKALFATIRRVK